MIDFLIALHTRLFFHLYGFTADTPLLQKIVIFIGKTIDVYVVCAAVAVLFFFLYRSFLKKKGQHFFLIFEELIQILVSVFSAYFVSFFLKHTIQAPRPFLRFPDKVDPLFMHGGFNSFPSGHATLFMALGVMIYLHHKKLGILFIILAFLIAVARVISGIHFPIDILVGWLIGAGISYFVYQRIK